MKSRGRIVLVCFLAVMGFGALFRLHGFEETWRLWNVPTMTPRFADARGITGALDSYAMGLDPRVDNPGDPWGRPWVYPRTWFVLHCFGVDARHTDLLAAVFYLCFFVGLCLILPRASWTTMAWVLALLLSPAVLLGFERANSDLPMFFLLAVSVVCTAKKPMLSAAFILIGTTFKLYPVFGAAVFLGLAPHRFWKYALGISAFTACVVGLTYAEVSHARDIFDEILWCAYGFNVFWMRTANFSPTLGAVARIVSYIALAGAGFSAAIALLRKDSDLGVSTPPLDLDAFRAGAAIYLATFLSGNQYDYKLMFLILAIPQLSAWTRSSVRPVSACAKLALVAMLVSAWELWVARMVYPLPLGKLSALFVDKMADWALFASLLFLFSLSMPEWIKEDCRNVCRRLAVPWPSRQKS